MDRTSTPSEADDAQWMRQALELAARGRYGTSPNPMVGAVVLDADGRLAGCGYHAAFGSDHAEIVALREAGGRAAGGTLYVSLEPCNHQGKTPPCSDAVLAAGLQRVVVACRDPNPQASGGLERLAAAGVVVSCGVEEEQARALNRRWLYMVTSGLPSVTLKTAVSMDGRIATRTGESQWITGETARRRSLELREEHDAILVGIGTVLADNPRLTRRLGLNPVPRWRRIILDSMLRTPVDALIVQSEPQLTTIAHVPAAPEERRHRLAAAGVRILELPASADGRVELLPLLRQLGKEGIAALLVEGGAGVNGAFVDRGLVNEVYLLMAPMLIGGPAPAAVAGRGVSSLQDAPRFSIIGVEPYGEDIAVHAVRLEKQQGRPGPKQARRVVARTQAFDRVDEMREDLDDLVLTGSVGVPEGTPANPLADSARAPSIPGSGQSARDCTSRRQDPLVLGLKPAREGA